MHTFVKNHSKVIYLLFIFIWGQTVWDVAAITRCYGLLRTWLTDWHTDTAIFMLTINITSVVYKNYSVVIDRCPFLHLNPYPWETLLIPEYIGWILITLMNLKCASSTRKILKSTGWRLIIGRYSIFNDSDWGHKKTCLGQPYF